MTNDPDTSFKPILTVFIGTVSGAILGTIAVVLGASEGVVILATVIPWAAGAAYARKTLWRKTP